MKKLLTLAAVALLGAASASATNYVVWSGDDLTSDEVQIPYNYYGWYNEQVEVIDDVTSTEGKALKFTAQDKGASTSSGYHCPEGDFSLSTLAELDLVFIAKIEGAGTWTVRLTPPDPSDQAIAIPADGEYHEVRFNLPKHFAALSNEWKTATNGYVFSVIGSNLSPEAALYVYDVHYETAIPMPEVTASVSDITTTSAVLNFEASFPEGYTNTSVTVDGEAAEGNSMALTGLAPKTEYTHTVVATGTYSNGEVFTASETVRFKTLREAGNDPVWYGQFDGVATQRGKEFPMHIDYNVTYNADKTLTVYAEFKGGETIEGLVNRQLSFVRGLIEEWTFMTAEGEGWIYTTEGTVEDGTEVEFFFWLPYAEGVFGGDHHQVYTAGSENEKPATAPRVKAEASNITTNSAEIVWEITNASEFTDLVVKINDETVETNPFVIGNLESNTVYTYTISASGVINGETLVSQPVNVTFRTLREGAVDIVYADYVNAELKNAYLAGEDASMARTFYVSLPWQVTYTAAGEGKYEIDLSQIGTIVGLVPQIYWDGFKALAKNDETGWYEYNFGAQELDATVAISHYLAYAGGVLDQRTPYTQWGMEKELPELGEPASIELMAPALVSMNVPFEVLSVCKDNAGHYLGSDAVVLSGEGVTFDGNMGLIAAKGVYVIKASVGELYREVSVCCAASESSANMAAGLVPYAYSEFNVGTAAGLTDGNSGPGSESIWNCTETDQERYIYFDLGEPKDIESIHITWEGAYATGYRLIFSMSELKPAGQAESVMGYAVGSEHVITVDNNANTESIHPIVNENGEYDALTARYVGLETSKALNYNWGIKPREFRILGASEGTITSVENIAVGTNEDAPVEYFNLQGVRVENPANGVYIRRQGSAVSKVVLR